MPVSDRSHELIQKYFEALVGEAELAELEGLLAVDPDVAVAFASAARLHAGLQSYFQKQYKIDQVAALLDASRSDPSSTSEIPLGRSAAPSQSGAEAEALPRSSAFVPIDARLIQPRRVRSWKRSAGSPHRWKWIAAVAVLLVLGVGAWTFITSIGERPRIVSGHVTVAGREVAALPEHTMFEVVGNGAEIELSGGVRIELLASTRATIRRSGGQYIVQLASGGGRFHVPQRQPAFDVETLLGVVSTTGGRFSMDLVTTLPEQFSSTERLRLPSLAVVVAEGSVAVKHAGILTTLAAGEQHVFFNPT